jgi:hypothetical protein
MILLKSKSFIERRHMSHPLYFLDDSFHIWGKRGPMLVMHFAILLGLFNGC